MLVLSRKVGERIQLGDNITVTLVKINGNAVRLGIEAPSHMTVMREEVATRNQGQPAQVERPAPSAAR
jgi:carbon storage regulator